jgi:hypothetical protein
MYTKVHCLKSLDFFSLVNANLHRTCYLTLWPISFCIYMECVLPDVKSTFTILDSAYGREIIFSS